MTETLYIPPCEPSVCDMRICVCENDVAAKFRCHVEDCMCPLCICERPCIVKNCDCKTCICPKLRLVRSKCQVAGCDCLICVCEKICHLPDCDCPICVCPKERRVCHVPNCDCPYCICKIPPPVSHCRCIICECLRESDYSFFVGYDANCKCTVCLCIRVCSCVKCKNLVCGGARRKGEERICDCIFCVCRKDPDEPLGHPPDCQCALCHCARTCTCTVCMCYRTKDPTYLESTFKITYIGERPPNPKKFADLMSKGQRDADNYLIVHKIFEIFHFLMSHIIVNVPESPVDFLLDLLERLLQFRDDDKEPPLLFEEKHIESVFKVLDPMATELISYNQYLIAMKTLGVNNYNKRPSFTDEGLITKTYFMTQTQRWMAKTLRGLVRPDCHVKGCDCDQCVCLRRGDPVISPSAQRLLDMNRMGRCRVQNCNCEVCRCKRKIGLDTCHVPGCQCPVCICSKRDPATLCHVAGCQCPECICPKSPPPRKCTVPDCTCPVCICPKPPEPGKCTVPDCTCPLCICPKPPEPGKCTVPDCTCPLCICPKPPEPGKCTVPDCTCPLCICPKPQPECTCIVCLCEKPATVCHVKDCKCLRCVCPKGADLEKWYQVMKKRRRCRRPECTGKQCVCPSESDDSFPQNPHVCRVKDCDCPECICAKGKSGGAGTGASSEAHSKRGSVGEKHGVYNTSDDEGGKTRHVIGCTCAKCVCKKIKHFG